MSDNRSIIPSERLRVFISSAQKEESGFDWLTLRRGIRDYLAKDRYLNPFIIEDSASSSPSTSYYRRQVAHTDIYVLLVKGDVRTGTKDEFRLAKEYKKPMLVYFLEDDNPNVEVNRLKSELESGDLCTYRPVRSFDNIKKLIYNDLRNEQIITYQDSGAQRKREEQLPALSSHNEPWVYRIIITDDNSEPREMLRTALNEEFKKSPQYKVDIDEVITANEAVLKAVDHHYDVYVLDVAIDQKRGHGLSMYQPYGVELVKAILSETPNKDIKQRFIIYSKLPRDVAMKEYNKDSIDYPKEYYSVEYYSKRKVSADALASDLRSYLDNEFFNTVG